MKVLNWMILGVVPIFAASAQATLISNWQFENNLVDGVGPNNGTDNGGVGYSTGMSGSGLLLNGANYVSVANPISGGLQSASGFTVAAWIRRDSDSTTFGTGSIFNLRTASSNSGFTLEQSFGSPNSMSFAVNTNGTTSFDTLTIGGWASTKFEHIAASFDAASHLLKLYRNGALIGSMTSNNSLMTTSASDNFEIGDNIANGSKWIGMIDDARFYNSALTDAQVAALVPEPASIALLGIGALALALRKRSKVK